MYIVIDVGGTKTLIMGFEKDGSVVGSTKFPTPQSYPDFIALLESTLKTTPAFATAQVERCAIALPGVLDRENGIAIIFGNLPWENVPIMTDLQKIINCPVILENDAKMAAVAEAKAVSELYKRVLYVTVSTGIGLGLVVDGVLDHSVHDAGGKVMIMEHQGKLMPWEEFASGKAIVARTGKRASEITDETDWIVIARDIAIGLIELIVTLSPDCIVLGGGVGAHLSKFIHQLHDELEMHLSKMNIAVPQIRQSAHPEEAVAFGGYILCSST